MQISFFVEFSKTDLAYLKFLTWDTKLYISAKNLQEFNDIKKSFKNDHIKEYIYWPVLSKKEGYWISPFSNRAGLKRIFEELRNKKLPVMIDAELPTTRNPFLYFTQLFNFFRNRKTIRTFIKDYKRCYIAEYYPQGKISNFLLGFLGLHFDQAKYNCKTIKMVYHSLHNFNNNFISKELSEGINKFGKNYLVAYGIMYYGKGWEPKISLPRLKDDLNIAKKAEIHEIVIYRLAGLNESTSSLFKEYLT